MYLFFRAVNLCIGIYYVDILVLNNFDSLTNLLNLDIQDLIFWGQRLEQYVKRGNKKEI